MKINKKIRLLNPDNRIGVVEEGGETYFLILNPDRLKADASSLLTKQRGKAELSNRIHETIKNEMDIKKEEIK